MVFVIMVLAYFQLLKLADDDNAMAMKESDNRGCISGLCGLPRFAEHMPLAYRAPAA